MIRLALEWYGQTFRFLSFSEAVTAFCGNSRMIVLALKGHVGFAARNSDAITAPGLQMMYFGRRTPYLMETESCPGTARVFSGLKTNSDI